MSTKETKSLANLSDTSQLSNNSLQIGDDSSGCMLQGFMVTDGSHNQGLALHFGESGGTFTVDGDARVNDDLSLKSDGAILNFGASDNVKLTHVAGGGMNLDCAAAFELNSSGGALNIGNDDVAQAINIGTGAAARTITVGNVTGATALDVNLGTGGLTVDCTDGGAISLDANGAPSNFTLTSTADADDLTIAVAGATNSSLVLSSTGTGADAVQLTSSAGGMDITSDGAMDVTTSDNNSNITINPHGSGTLALGSASKTLARVDAIAVTLTSVKALT